MADFLTRLAQRTLGLAPIVQPRLISRFAPAPESMIASDYAFNASSRPELNSRTPTATKDVATNQASIEAIAQQIYIPIPQIPNSPNSSPRDSSVRSLESVTPQLSFPEQNSLLLVSESSQKPPPAPQNSPTVQPEKPTNSLQHITENRTNPDSPNQTILNQQTVPIPPLVSSKFTDLSSTISVGIQEVNSLFSHPPKSPENKDKNGEQLPVETENSNFNQLSNAYFNLPTPLINQENRKTLESASLPPSITNLSPLIQPSSQPTIEIRIGRIEVRSIPNSPPKPPPKSTTKKPTLSLRDYLNQRNGGEL